MPSWTYNLSRDVTLDYIYKENLLRGSREWEMKLPVRKMVRNSTKLIEKMGSSSRLKLNLKNSTLINKNKEARKRRPRIEYEEEKVS